jgi:hypothetical protein
MQTRSLGFFAVLMVPSLAIAQSAPVGTTGSATVGVSGSVTMQQAPPAQPTPTTMTPVQVPTVACPPTADALYTEGMNRMASGDDTGAANLFGRVIELCPNHATAREMQRVALSHSTGQNTGTSTTSVTPVMVTPQGMGPANGQIGVLAGGRDFIPNENALYGPESRTWGARFSLVASVTLHSIYFGIIFPGMFVTPVPAQAPAAGALLGGAIGVTGSILATMDGATSGQALTMSLVPLIGELAGFGGALLTGLNNSQPIFGMLTLGAAIGLGGGAAIAYSRPLAGRVNLAASSSLWGGMVSSHIALALISNSSGGQGPLMGGMLLAGLGVGGLVGGLLAPGTRISSERMWYIDASMGGGWLVFGLSSALFASAGGSGSGTLVAYSIGSIAGVALGALFGVLVTRNTDRYWEEVHPAQEQMNRAQPQAPTARRTIRPQFMVSPGVGNVTVGSPVPMTLNFSGSF